MRRSNETAAHFNYARAVFVMKRDFACPRLLRQKMCA